MDYDTSSITQLRHSPQFPTSIDIFESFMSNQFMQQQVIPYVEERNSDWLLRGDRPFLNNVLQDTTCLWYLSIKAVIKSSRKAILSCMYIDEIFWSVPMHITGQSKRCFREGCVSVLYATGVAFRRMNLYISCV